MLLEDSDVPQPRSQQAISAALFLQFAEGLKRILHQRVGELDSGREVRLVEGHRLRFAHAGVAGDGRVVIAAAKKYGVKAVGFEIDPGLVKLARENVRNEGVERLVEIRQQDFLTADLSPATVVTLYLSYDGNLALRPQLMRQLKPGARIVSYTFDMGDWQPKIFEAYRDAAGESHALYLWEIGGPVVFSDLRR